MRIILTDVGEQLASEGFLTGVFPKITKVWFGDGNGSEVIPNTSMTSLTNMIYEGVGTVIARFNTPNRLYIYTQIPASVGDITVREIGLLTEDNTLIAIGGELEKYKPPISESVEKMDFYITLPISSTQEITVEFSNTNLYASQEALDVVANAEEANRLSIITKLTKTDNAVSASKLKMDVAGSTCALLFSNTPAGYSSLKEVDNYSDAPNLGSWFIHNIRHSTDGNLYGMQVAYGWNANATIVYQRTVSNGVWSGWFSISIFKGMITLWSGLISTIPNGWHLCDGSNGTPDLRNKFIVGASVDVDSNSNTSITGSNTKIGGNKDAIVVSHNHTQAAHTHSQAAHTHGDQGHEHSAWTDGQGNHAHTTQGHVSNNKFLYSGGGGVNGTGIPYSAGAWTSEAGHHAHNVGIAAGYANLATATPAIHAATPTINNTGSSAANANLPPYFALAYIMKL